MKRTTQSPVKVYEDTRERVRLVAALTGRSQAEVLDTAVREYVDRHADDLSRGVDRARDTLLGPGALDDTLRSMRDEIVAAAERHGARNVRLFGSAVRREADARSDVDLLVDLEPGRSLFDLAGLAVELEQILGRSVDVVTEAGLRPRIRERVLSEARPV